MRHTILNVAYPLTPVGPDAPGGSEQILTLLDGALTSSGHHSLVLAASNSVVTGALIEAPSVSGDITPSIRKRAQHAHRRLIEDTLERYPVDLVHMHSLDFHQYIPRGSTPVISTLHLPIDWYPPKIFHSERRNYFLNCVSSSQQRHCPSTSHLLPSITNGIEVDRFRMRTDKGGYTLALGRICPEKGFHLALDASKRARSEMILAGPVIRYTPHEEYFRREIQPRLDDRRKFVGPVGFSGKRKLLARARCLLVTSSVAETSSLVAMEALASGTPVIAFPSGALPEIIEQGRTGFIVSDVTEMADAIREASKLNPDDCRRSAQTRFSAKAMLSRYLEMYEKIISRSQQAQAPHRNTSWLFSWSKGTPGPGHPQTEFQPGSALKIPTCQKLRHSPNAVE